MALSAWALVAPSSTHPTLLHSPFLPPPLTLPSSTHPILLHSPSLPPPLTLPSSTRPFFLLHSPYPPPLALSPSSTHHLSLLHSPSLPPPLTLPSFTHPTLLHAPSLPPPLTLPYSTHPTLLHSPSLCRTTRPSPSPSSPPLAIASAKRLFLSCIASACEARRVSSHAYPCQAHGLGEQSCLSLPGPSPPNEAIQRGLHTCARTSRRRICRTSFGASSASPWANWQRCPFLHLPLPPWKAGQRCRKIPRRGPGGGIPASRRQHARA